MPDERRKLRRRHLLYYLQVFDRRTNRLLGHLVDITPEGILVMSERPLRIGRTIPLRMQLPGAAGQDETVEFEATSLWSAKDVNPDFYDTGFKVEQISRAQLGFLETLIDDYGFRD